MKNWSYDVQGGPPSGDCGNYHREDETAFRCSACSEGRKRAEVAAAEFTEGVNAVLLTLRQRAGELFSEGKDEEAHAIRAAADWAAENTRDWRQI